MKNLPKSDVSLFERLGGKPALETVVRRMYRRILDDAQLAPFFDGTDIASLRARQVKFLTVAFGGPGRWGGRDMAAAHAGMGITMNDFERVAAHLDAALKSAKVPSTLRHEVLSAAAGLADQIVDAKPTAANDAGTNPENEEEEENKDNVMAIAHASTAQDQQPRALFDTEDGLHAAMVGLPTATLLVGDDLTVAFANPAAEDLFEALGADLPFRKLVGTELSALVGRSRRFERELDTCREWPMRQEPDFGPHRLELLIHPVTVADADGGFVVTVENVTERREGAMELARLRKMIDAVPMNVVFADPDGIIQYANPAALEMLHKLAQHLPVPVDRIVGSSYDVFHSNPSHNRAVVGNAARLPHETTIHLGPETLTIRVDAVTDEEGHRLGSMVALEVVTDKVAAQESLARVESMMENAPINVIFADPDGVIRYMNPASLDTLRGLNQHLPVPADEILGGSFDVFHKQPHVQRAIVKDPSRLPHRAVISVGPEKLDLLVSAVQAPDGRYLGAMLTWAVITEKLANEAEVKRLGEEAEAARADLQARVDEMLTVVQAAAKGDLTQEVNVAGDGAIAAMGRGLEGFLTEMRTSLQTIGKGGLAMASAAEELGAVGKQVGENADETAGLANTSVAAAEQVSANISTVATSAEQMSASIREIAINAAEAARVATSASTLAAETNESVQKLGDSSQEIGNVVKVITSIAQQTNLLALNATIEAARAGEAGKGFAVVANEVKELAKETAAATEDISKKIEAIQTDTRGAVESIAQINEIIARINEIQNTIATAVDEQSATTAEITRNVAEAAEGASSITENITRVAEAADNTTQAMRESLGAIDQVSELAAELQQLVSKFRTE